MDNTLIEMALSAAGLAVLLLDEDDRVVEVNLPAARMLGSDPSEIMGKSASAFLPMAAIRSSAVDPMPARSPCLGIEIVGRDSANRAFPVAVNAFRWTDPGGRNLMTLFLGDLAAERKAQPITQSQLVQSDNAIRGANIGVFEYDPVKDTVNVSDIWRKLLELGPDDHLDVQREWQSRVHPDDLATALEPVRLCLEEGVEQASCEYRLHSRDRQHWRWMRTDIAVARRDPEGRPSLLVGAQTDITERKKTEESLRLSVAQFRSAFDHAPIGKAIVGLDGTWKAVNPALCALLGYTEDEFLRSDFQSLTHPDDLEANLELLRLLLEGKIPTYTLEKRYYRANGAIMWGRLSVGLVRDDEGRPNHLISQIVDITEQRRLDELRNEFVSVVSHELRTPLTSILGALTLLDFEDDPRFSDEVQRLLFIAKTNGDRLHNLINDILDFQKFSARQMRFSLSLHPVAKLVEDSLMANLASADKYGVRYSTQIPDRTLIGLVDAKRFHQVMANLLSNATKFGNPDSLVEVSTERWGGAIRVSVTNSGEGIPASFRDRVFTPFSQAASISDRRTGGTGLGLSITKQIVEQMGGEIGFESTPGKTTTFWFTIRAGGDAR